MGFHALNRKLNKEYVDLDWRKSKGRTTGAATGGAAAAREFQRESGLVVGDPRERAKLAAERRLHLTTAEADAADAAAAADGAGEAVDGGSSEGGGGSGVAQCACGAFHGYTGGDTTATSACPIADGTTAANDGGGHDDGGGGGAAAAAVDGMEVDA